MSIHWVMGLGSISSLGLSMRTYTSSRTDDIHSLTFRECAIFLVFLVRRNVKLSNFGLFPLNEMAVWYVFIWVADWLFKRLSASIVNLISETQVLISLCVRIIRNSFSKSEFSISSLTPALLVLPPTGRYSGKTRDVHVKACK